MLKLLVIAASTLVPVALAHQVSGTAGTYDRSGTAQSGPREVKWDTYTYQFDATGTTARVFEGGKPVGRILPRGGQLEIVAFVVGGDADRLKKSFADYQAFTARTNSATPPVPPLANAQSAPPSAAVSAKSCTLATMEAEEENPSLGTVSFDNATKVITDTRNNGMTIIFNSQDIKISCGPLNYTLRKQKGSVGRVFESSILHPKNNGGSITGAGVEFLMNGSLLYDSGMGHYGDMQTNTKLRSAKHISEIAVAAVEDVRKVEGHQSFTPQGYDTIKEIAQYKLRSDGSR